MKIAVITSVTGLKNSKILDPISNNFSIPGQVDYYAFVDREHDCKIWKQIDLPKYNLIDTEYADRRNAKLPKVLGSLLVPGYDYYIWHDHHCELVVKPEDVIKKYLDDADIAVFKHPHRNCVYDEIEIVQHYGVDHAKNLIEIKYFFDSNSYPRRAGLYELTSFVYRNSPKMQTAMLSWWQLICKFSSRDQISFPYIVKTHNLKCNIMPGSGLAYAGNNKIIPEIRNKIG